MTTSMIRPLILGTAVSLGLGLGCTGGGGTAPGQSIAPPNATTVLVAPPPPPPIPVAPPAMVNAMMASEGCIGGVVPQNPVEYGLCKVGLAKARAKSAAKVSVVLASDPAAQGLTVDPRPESYQAFTRGDETIVVGRDPVGALYGAMDIVERLDEFGAAALPLTTEVKGSPVLSVRGAQMVVTLPEEGRPWWFREPAFWTEYLDMMVRGRLNFLDMHGMYNLSDTLFVNPLLYFANARSAPQLGLPAAEREFNLAMLNSVIAMAKVRGIKVGLMGYRADVAPKDPRGKKETPEEEQLAPIYSREAVADLATRAPGLDYIGFRVGESNRDPDWFADNYIGAMHAAHSRAIPYTRTWLTNKKKLARVIAEGGPETLIEVKYNGEQLGSPYVISGGNMQHWYSYSYEDFLTPPTPYKFVFHVRAGGTHRVFRYASYARTRESVISMLMSPRVAGMTLEAAHAYLPQRDFYHANPADSFSPYAFRRDELSYILFGRLSYDPNTPEHIFRAMLRERVGTDGLWDAVQAASDIVPWHQQAHTCGPDQRQYAPELEMGGNVAYWASPPNTKGKPGCGIWGQRAFDAFALSVPYDAATDLLEGKGSPRLSPVDTALVVLADARKAREAAHVQVDPQNVEARDYVRECLALADLGDWLGHKLRGATALAVYQGSGSAPWLDAAKSETRAADAAWTALAQATGYIAPFEERMRMKGIGLMNYHWREQVPRLAEDMQSIDEVVKEVAESKPHAKAHLPDPKAWLDKARFPGPGLANLVITPNDASAPEWTVTATFANPVPKGTVVKILHRTFNSQGGGWGSADASGNGTTYTARVPGTHEGAMFAVEVNAGPGLAWRYPDVLKEVPYRPLAP